jgi:hypothetical protein
MGHYRCFEPPLVRQGQAIHRSSRGLAPPRRREALQGSPQNLFQSIHGARDGVSPSHVETYGSTGTQMRRARAGWMALENCS